MNRQPPERESKRIQQNAAERSRGAWNWTLASIWALTATAALTLNRESGLFAPAATLATGGVVVVGIRGAIALGERLDNLENELLSSEQSLLRRLAPLREALELTGGGIVAAIAGLTGLAAAIVLLFLCILALRWLWELAGALLH